MEKIDSNSEGRKHLRPIYGIDVERNKEWTSITQPYLAQRIVEVLKLSDCNLKKNPARKPMLQKDESGEPSILDNHYWSVVVMLNYLTKNTRPDLDMAVHQISHFCQIPRHSHKMVVWLMGEYLKGTQSNGMIFTPDTSKRVECYVYADFVGAVMQIMWMMLARFCQELEM